MPEQPTHVSLTKLQLALTRLGFIRVTGLEVTLFCTTRKLKSGPPLRYADNNGWFAVSDERGDVWVTPFTEAQNREVHALRHRFNVRPGLSVPLSNQEEVVNLRLLFFRFQDPFYELEEV